MRTTLGYSCATVILLTLGASTPGTAWAGEGGPDLQRELSRRVAQLSHKREHKRLQAIEKLGRLGKSARSTLPRLLQILEKGEPTAQVSAARAVARIAPTDVKVCAALSAIVRDTSSHYQLRRTATFGLGHIATQSEALRPTIIKLMSEELRAQRHGNRVDVALADSLGRLGTDAYRAGPSLQKALEKTPFDDVKSSAFVAMARVSPVDPDADVSKLTEDVRTGGLANKARAFGQLRALGKQGRAGMAALLAACAPDRPLYERVAAMDTLAAVYPSNPKAIAFFVDAIRSDHYLLEPAGEKALGVLGRIHVKTAVFPLLVELDRSDGDAKRRVLETLRRVGPREPEVVEAIVQTVAKLTAKDEELVVQAVLEAVRSGAPMTKPAGRDLLRIANSADPFHQGRAPVEVDFLVGHSLVVLSEIGMPDDAAPVVLKAFAEDRPYVRPAAIRCVGMLGPVGAPAVAQLVTMLERGPVWTPMLPYLHDAFPSVEAIRALGRIGPSARAAIPILTKIANRSRADASEIAVLEGQAARKALSQIQG